MNQSINASVGNNGTNSLSDVSTVQTLLNKNIPKLMPLLPLKIDGFCGPITIGIILEFQRRIVQLLKPDGRVDPNGKTLKALVDRTNPELNKNTSVDFDHLLMRAQHIAATKSPTSPPNRRSRSLIDGDYQKVANLLSVDIATIKAIASVESMGEGFLSNGKPKILFEGHWFSKLTDRAYDKTHPTISYKTWTKQHYIGGAGEYGRYQMAEALNREAAMKSTSWGAFQIMGFNYTHAGYSSVEQFVTAMKESESKQLLALASFLKSRGLDVYLRGANWKEFALRYNGPAYEENRYAIKLEQAYKAYSAN